MARLDDAELAWVEKLVARQRSGYALDQAFYADPRIFQQDVERIVFRQWLLAGHVSRIPSPGDYFLFEIGGESVIVIRGRDGEIRALLNVCRHRGSRVCVQAQGNARSLVCPYHAWSYSTDGALIGARSTPPDFDRSTFGLHRLHVRVHEGLIFISFADRPLDLDPAAREMAAFLGPHDLEHTKIATRKTYPVAANWKLVLENFYECYHCAPAHREYCSANPSAYHFDQGARGQRYAALVKEWNERAEALGHKTGEAHVDLRSLPDSLQYYGFSRGPLESGYQTQSEDGKPVAPLMGHLKEYDGGETQSGIGPLASVLGYSDYALVFQFLPISVTRTDVEATWLVAESAREGVDYELERLVWLWDVTTQQDTKITEDNQLGVGSHFYRPGPYTGGESTTALFTDWYLRQIA